MSRELDKLNQTVKQYRFKIKELDRQLRSDKPTIELPCKHAEYISELEVHLKSKENELKHLNEHLNSLVKSNDSEMNYWHSKYDKVREEVKKL